MPDLIDFYKSIYFINRLFANIYQCKVDNIILPKSALRMLHKKDAHIPFFFFMIKAILKQKQMSF